MSGAHGQEGGNPAPVERLIRAFVKMPGIGRRSAERMAMHVLRSTAEEAEELLSSMRDVRERVAPCSYCFNLTDSDPCRVCADAGRDRSLLMVVEQSRDLVNLESTGFFRGVYHVLGGSIDPLSGVQPEDLTMDRLEARIDDPARNCGGVQVAEVVLGLNPTLEGDGTSLYLSELLRRRPVRVTRLARGLPAGSQLDFASPAVLADAIAGRESVSSPPAGASSRGTLS